MNETSDEFQLSHEESKDIYRAWPYASHRQVGETIDLRKIRSDVLDFFGIDESRTADTPASVEHLLFQLREEYGVFDTTIEERTNQSLTGDSGLMMYCNANSIVLIKPDRWLRHPVPIGKDGQIILLLHVLPNQPVSVVQLFKRVLFGRFSQFVTIVGVVCLAVLISLIPTWLQAYIFDTLVPDGSKFLLIQIAAFIFMLRMTSRGLRLFNQFVALRLELILGFQATGLLVHRLTQLPLSFFQTYSVGDLQQRISSAHAVRRALQGSLIAFVTSIFTVILNLLLIYFKSGSLMMCLYLLILTMFGPVVDVVSAGFESYFRLKKLSVAGALQDVILFPLQSLSTVRSLGIESDVFSQFSRLRYRLARLDINLILIRDLLKVFSLLLSALIISFLFYILSTDQSSSISGDQSSLASQGMIVLLLSSFSTINGAVRSFSSSLLSLVKVIPDVIRFRPILNQESLMIQSIASKASTIDSVHIYFQVKSTYDKSLSSSISLGSQVNMALLESRSGYSQDLMRIVSEFGMVNSNTSSIILQRLMINDDRPIDRQNFPSLRRNTIYVDGKSAFLPGSIIDNITDFQATIHRSRLDECLDIFQLPKDDAWLHQNADTLLSELRRGDKTHTQSKIMLVRALYYRFNLILIGRCIDFLDTDEVRSMISYCKAHL